MAVQAPAPAGASGRVQPPRPAESRSSTGDATTVLTVWLALSLFVPSAAVLPALGSAGAPSTILGLGIALWWVWNRVNHVGSLHGPRQPVRIALLVFMVVILVIYRQAMAQPVVAAEILPADSGLLHLVAIAGVVLTAADGISSLARLRLLIGRLSGMLAVVAVVGLLQLILKAPLVDHLVPPGLVLNGDQGGLIARGSFLRPAGTSIHPIEFGAVLSMCLPLMLWFARTERRHRGWAWLAVGLVVANIGLSISRSALLATAAALLVLVPVWSRRDRLRALSVAAVLVAGAAVALPGLLGTVRGLFLLAGDDTSVQSRTGAYDYALRMFGTSPWWGRGYGTFLPSYYIFDNGYLQMLLEGGVVGLTALLLLLTAAGYCAGRSSSLLVIPQERELGRSLMASVLAGILSIAFFDLFSFPQSAGILGLVIGCSGAAYRLARVLRDDAAVRLAAATSAVPASDRMPVLSAVSPAPTTGDRIEQWSRPPRPHVAVHSGTGSATTTPTGTRPTRRATDVGPALGLVAIGLGTVLVLLGSAQAHRSGLTGAGWTILACAGIVAALRPELRERNRVVMTAALALALGVVGTWQLRGGATGPVGDVVVTTTGLPAAVVLVVLLVVEQAVVVGAVLVAAGRCRVPSRAAIALAVLASAASALLLPPGRVTGAVLLAGIALGGLALLSAQVGSRTTEVAQRGRHRHGSRASSGRRWWSGVVVGAVVAAGCVVPAVVSTQEARSGSPAAGAVDARGPAAAVALQVARVDGARVHVVVSGAPAGAVLAVTPPTGPVTTSPLGGASSTSGRRTGVVVLSGSGRYVVAVRTAAGAVLSTLVVQR